MKNECRPLCIVHIHVFIVRSNFISWENLKISFILYRIKTGHRKIALFVCQHPDPSDPNLIPNLTNGQLWVGGPPGAGRGLGCRGLCLRHVCYCVTQCHAVSRPRIPVAR